MLFKQKPDDIQLKKWLDSRFYLDSLQIKHFRSFFGQILGTLQNLDCGLWTGPWTGLWTEIWTKFYLLLEIRENLQWQLTKCISITQYTEKQKFYIKYNLLNVLYGPLQAMYQIL